ncbi:MAG: peptidase M20 [Planctomycetia bacterium 21-64-5]|nr:MAG: peptidase M20 [Planctomycetia bacterium 21-64-5]
MRASRPNLPFAISLLVACLIPGTAPLRAAGPADWVQGDNLEQLVTLYRYFHSHPELSMQEKETAARLAKELEATGAKVTQNVGGHGVVAVMENGPGKTLLIRTDLDALPVTERTDLVYASKVTVKGESGLETGVMHACGHDIHITSLVGVARYLAANKDKWSGTVVFIGQPAEERGEGAKAMLDDGLLKRFPRPDFALALHVDSTLASDKVGYLAGYALANVDSVDIVVRGKGGHGAFPHMTIDPIVEAARLILDLQTLVSRETKPTEPAVVTVGSIHGGTKHNVIADTCHLQLTVRSYSDEVRQKLIDGIKRKAKASAASSGAPEPTVTVTEGTPAMYNDDKLVARLMPVFRKTFGDDRVVPSEPSMGGEDFSRYGLAGVPSFMFRVGGLEEKRLARYKQLGQLPPSLHSPLFYPDAEPTLATGVTAMSAAALDLLGKGGTTSR